MSSAGDAAYSSIPSCASSGRSSSPRTITQRIEEKSDGAARSPRAAIPIWSALVSVTSDSGSAARTAVIAADTVRWLRNSSGPVTKVTWPRMSDACGFAMVPTPSHMPPTEPRHSPGRRSRVAWWVRRHERTSPSRRARTRPDPPRQHRRPTRHQRRSSVARPHRRPLPRPASDRPGRHGNRLAVPRRDPAPRRGREAGRPAAQRVGHRLRARAPRGALLRRR